MTPAPALGAVLLVLSGCRGDPSSPPDAGRDATAPPGDAGGQRDTGPEPSPCPLPRPVTPWDVPPGYMAPTTVGVIRVVDGDTAHFLFGDDDQTVRFLFVNTEESYGEEATEFGQATGEDVRDEIENADSVMVAVREDEPGTGEPDLDPYDRWLSLVFVNGELYQTHLVREGQSAYYTRYGCAPEPVHTNLLAAEAEAHAARRGIWAAGHPTDYSVILDEWIGDDHCRPNPYREPYCP